MVALLVPRIWLADLLARCQGIRSVLGSIGELLCMCCTTGILDDDTSAAVCNCLGS